jgi:tetratricopeptide (TPR) repeat protein
VVKKSKASTMAELIREKKMKDAEDALVKGEFEEAAKLFKEIASICFELEEFDIGMELVNKAEKLLLFEFDEDFDKSSRTLISLQDQASKAFRRQEYQESIKILKKMVAIAENKKDPVLVKNYKENIKKAKMMMKRKKT